MNALQSLFFTIFDFVNLPSIDDNIIFFIYDFVDLLDYATSIIGFFIPSGAWRLLYPIWVAMFSISHLYPLIMWIVRKIPLSIN